MKEQTAGPPDAQRANHERHASAPPQTPSGVFVSLLGDRQKQKEAWLHHCLHHGDNLHIYHLAISPYSRSLFPSLSCHYSSLIITFAQLRHAKIRARDKSIGMCVQQWQNTEEELRSLSVFEDDALIYPITPGLHLHKHTHAVRVSSGVRLHTLCSETLESAQKKCLSRSAWCQTNKPKKQNSYCEVQQEFFESGSRHQKKHCNL